MTRKPRRRGAFCPMHLNREVPFRTTQRKPMWLVEVSIASRHPDRRDHARPRELAEIAMRTDWEVERVIHYEHEPQAYAAILRYSA